jgi:hypothetical protein
MRFKFILDLIYSVLSVFLFILIYYNIILPNKFSPKLLVETSQSILLSSISDLLADSFIYFLCFLNKKIYKKLKK